jgi:DNA polymerase-3 subunit gamma/tau
MRDALSLTDQVLSLGDGTITPQRVRDALGLVPEDEFLELLSIIAEHRAAEVFPFVGRLAEAGVDFSTFLAGFGDVLRAQLAIVLGGQPTDVSDRAKEALQAGASRFQAADLVRMLTALTELEPRFRRSGQQQLLLETAMVRLALLDRTIDVESLLRSLGGGSDEVPAPAAAATRPPAPSHSRSPEPSRPVPSPARKEPTMEAPRPVQGIATPIQSSAQPARVTAPSGDQAPLDMSGLIGKWDALIARLRHANKTLLATALEHAQPTVVTSKGTITVALEEPNDFYARAIQTGAADAVGILREWFTPVEKLVLDGADKPAAPQKRMTDEMVKAEKLEALKKRDPVLHAAIVELDLEVID